MSEPKNTQRDNRNVASKANHKTSNKGGRPKSAKGLARTETMSTKFTVAEKKMVMVKIDESGKKPSVYMREQMLTGQVIAKRTKEDRQQIRMLEGGLNNLNQLTRLAHIANMRKIEDRLNILLDEFETILKRI